MYMAIGNNGEVLHGLEYPRKSLLERLGRQHASRVFRDSADGEKTWHVGYIVAGTWWDLYEVTPMRIEV